jgi:hypothetical protein
MGSLAQQSDVSGELLSACLGCLGMVAAGALVHPMCLLYLAPDGAAHGAALQACTYEGCCRSNAGLLV